MVTAAGNPCAPSQYPLRTLSVPSQCPLRLVAQLAALPAVAARACCPTLPLPYPPLTLTLNAGGTVRGLLCAPAGGGRLDRDSVAG